MSSFCANLVFFFKLCFSRYASDSDNCVAGKKGHKGRGKQFSNPEEIDRQMKEQRELVSETPFVTVTVLA